MRTFWEQINKFDDPNYISDDDLTTAKAVLRNRIIFDSEKLSDFSHTVSFWWATAGLDYYEHYLDNLSKVTKEDIRNYVQKYVKGKPYVLGIALSKTSQAKIEQLTGKPFDPKNYIHTTVNP